jgi:hypothetical protein
MKLTKQIINISNKQIATKIMGSKSDRKKFNYKNDKRKKKTVFATSGKYILSKIKIYIFFLKPNNLVYIKALFVC